MNHRTIQQVLEHCFEEKHQQRTAILQPGRQITYGGLNKAAERLAAQLDTLNVKKGMHVGVAATDSVLTMVAAVAILKKAAVFVPLDTTHNADKLQSMITVSAPALIITEETEHPSLAYIATGVPRLRISTDDLLQPSTTSACGGYEGVYHADDPVYIYFTSGTTGEPKAVLGRNSGLSHFVHWERDTFHITEHAKFSQLTPPGHDPYLRDIFTALAANATICIPESKEVLLSPFQLRAWINEQQITHIHCTPTLFRNLLRAGLQPEDFPTLETVMLAGEPLHGRDVANWYHKIGNTAALVNLYGPTETTMAKLFHLISPEDSHRKIIPLGLPMTGTTAYVVNPETMARCQPEEPGELYISTEFCSLGYYNDPQAHAAAFVPDTFDRPGNVMYKTGDIVYQDHDGLFNFVARKDRMVKISGKQVQLQEVEHALLSHQDISTCTVVVVNDAAGETPELAAYYMSDEPVAAVALSGHLRDILPAHMVPLHFIRIDTIPQNANGKISLEQLPAPVRASAITGGQLAVADEEPPINKLTAIWKEILNRSEVNPDDVFMQIGGDSLAIMLLIAKVSETFDMELTIWQIFDDLTIEKLATLIKENETAIKQ